MEWIFLLDTMGTGLRMATPFILADLGGLISRSTGDLNIALEGFILVGVYSGPVKKGEVEFQRG
jgi:ABC-type uncharacterized transport system permease subunit